MYTYMYARMNIRSYVCMCACNHAWKLADAAAASDITARARIERLKCSLHQTPPHPKKNLQKVSSGCAIQYATAPNTQHPIHSTQYTAPNTQHPIHSTQYTAPNIQHPIHSKVSSQLTFENLNLQRGPPPPTPPPPIAALPVEERNESANLEIDTSVRSPALDASARRDPAV